MEPVQKERQQFLFIYYLDKSTFFYYFIFLKKGVPENRAAVSRETGGGTYQWLP